MTSYPAPIWRMVRLWATVLLVAALVGCDYEPPGPPGGHLWVIPVTNRSARPAVLVVADPTQAFLPGEVVGTATPSVVLPRTTVDMTFNVPPGKAWWIWANQGALLNQGVVAKAISIWASLMWARYASINPPRV